MAGLCTTVLLALLGRVAGDLTVLEYSNTALAGPPAVNRTIPGLEGITFDQPAREGLFSAEILGTLRLDRDTAYVFQCSFAGFAFAFLHVDDRLVCQAGVYQGSASDPSLRALTKSVLPLRMTLYHVDPAATSHNVTVRWSTLTLNNTTPSAPLLHTAHTLLSANGYWKWLGWNIDTPSHSMRNQGGDLDNVTLAQCLARCEALVASGCVGVVRSCSVGDADGASCFLRRKATPSDTCASLLTNVKEGYSTWTRNSSCIFTPPMPVNPSPGFACQHPSPVTPVDPSRLTAELPATELQRRALQQNLTQGWGHWYHNNFLVLARLPEGVTTSIALCQISTQQCVTQATADGRGTESAGCNGCVRAGPIAWDHSYMQYYFWMGGANVSLSIAGGAELAVLVEWVDNGTTAADRNDFVLALVGGTAWLRVSNVTVTGPASLRMAPYNLPSILLQAAVNSSVPTPVKVGLSQPHILLSLSNGPAAASTGTDQPRSLESITAQMQQARKLELARYEQFGADAEIKAAVQAGNMWNFIYTPIEYGPIFPVSEGWSFDHTTKPNPDFDYVIFDWDNIFASYMVSLDAKELAYSNFIQVIKSKTSDGFVPNFASGTVKSLDRTEPPIGAKVLLEMYRRHKDLWLVELLFDDLLDWNNWFVAQRTLAPLGLICLGGDNMQDARYESGLDNSPMYDGDDFYDPNTKHMQLYDVGMTSMFISEALALVELAQALGRPESIMLAQRAANMSSLLSAHLWDEVGGIFTNKFANNTFYRRVSPTSFYAMLTNAPTDAQAEAMMADYLMNRSRFCVNASGDPSNNNPDGCYWGLPSISADDPAFPSLGYWRGYVWGPMAQLVWWSLKNYDHIPAVREGRQGLCKQMTAMFLDQWRLNHHVCENFSPHKGVADCTGDHFYHWVTVVVVDNADADGRPAPVRGGMGDQVFLSGLRAPSGGFRSSSLRPMSFGRPEPTTPRSGGASTRSSVSNTPMSPEVFEAGMRVWVKDGSGRTGVVRFVGPTAFADGTWVGIELDPGFRGKHEGTVKDVCYFTCPPETGVFMLDSKVTAFQPGRTNGDAAGSDARSCTVSSTEDFAEESKQSDVGVHRLPAAANENKPTPRALSRARTVTTPTSAIRDLSEQLVESAETNVSLEVQLEAVRRDHAQDKTQYEVRIGELEQQLASRDHDELRSQCQQLVQQLQDQQATHETELQVLRSRCEVLEAATTSDDQPDDTARRFLELQVVHSATEAKLAATAARVAELAQSAEQFKQQSLQLQELSQCLAVAEAELAVKSDELATLAQQAAKVDPLSAEVQVLQQRLSAESIAVAELHSRLNQREAGQQDAASLTEKIEEQATLLAAADERTARLQSKLEITLAEAVATKDEMALLQRELKDRDCHIAAAKDKAVGYGKKLKEKEAQVAVAQEKYGQQLKATKEKHTILAKLQEKSAQQQKDLDSKDRDLAITKEKAARHFKELKEAKDRDEKNAKDLKGKCNELVKVQADLEVAQQQLVQRAIQIEEEQSTVAKLQADLAQATIDLQEKQAAISALVQQQQSPPQPAAAVLESATAAAIAEERCESGSAMIGIEAQIKQQEDRIALMNAQAKVKESAISTLSAQLKAKETEVVTLQAQLGEKMAAVDMLTALWDQQLTSLQLSVQNQRADAAQTTAGYDDHLKLQELQGHLQQAQASASLAAANAAAQQQQLVIQHQEQLKELECKLAAAEAIVATLRETPRAASVASPAIAELQAELQQTAARAQVDAQQMVIQHQEQLKELECKLAASEAIVATLREIQAAAASDVSVAAANSEGEAEHKLREQSLTMQYQQDFHDLQNRLVAAEATVTALREGQNAVEATRQAHQKTSAIETELVKLRMDLERLTGEAKVQAQELTISHQEQMHALQVRAATAEATVEALRASAAAVTAAVPPSPSESVSRQVDELTLKEKDVRLLEKDILLKEKEVQLNGLRQEMAASYYVTPAMLQELLGKDRDAGPVLDQVIDRSLSNMLVELNGRLVAYEAQNEAQNVEAQHSLHQLVEGGPPQTEHPEDEDFY